MRTPRIYFQDQIIVHTDIVLPPHTTHYLSHVLRLKQAAPLILFNGKGGEYEASIANIQKKQVIVRVHRFIPKDTESSLKIHLVQGIARGEKMDFVIQKAVELGVYEITPVLTEYSSIKLDEERLKKRMTHWQHIIISSCEQSGRTVLPTLHPVSSLTTFIEGCTSNMKFCCDPSFSATRINPSDKHNDAILLIGPEGGLSPSEVTASLQKSFKGLSLGPRILRTETAGIVACTLLQAAWGDL